MHVCTYRLLLDTPLRNFFALLMNNLRKKITSTCYSVNKWHKVILAFYKVLLLVSVPAAFCSSIILCVFSNLNTASSFPNTFLHTSFHNKTKQKQQVTIFHIIPTKHKLATHDRSPLRRKKKKHLPDKNQWTLSLNTHTAHQHNKNRRGLFQTSAFRKFCCWRFGDFTRIVGGSVMWMSVRWVMMMMIVSYQGRRGS